MSGQSAEPRSDPKSLLGFLLVLGAIVALLAYGVVQGAARDDTPAAAASETPTIDVTAPPPATPRGCRGGHVALTFDDGPSGTTGQILSYLEEAGARATFFNVGAREEQQPELVRRTAEEGHDFGNHSFDHAFLDELDLDDLQRNLLGTNQIHEQLGGRPLVWFRPPFGRTNADVQGIAESLGLEQVLWTNDTRDWDPDRSVRDVVRQVARAEDGDVVLLHDDGHLTTVLALPRILERLADRGICTGRLQQTDAEVRAWDGAIYHVTAGPWVD